MIARRAVALFVAIAIVGLALVVRDRFVDGDDDGARGDGPLRLVCATEMGQACRGLADEEGIETVVEPAGVTAARMTAAADAEELDVDGWLAPAPWAEIVRADRARAAAPPVLDAPSAPVARTPLVIAAWRQRAAVLEQHCGGTPEWSCLAEVAGTPWADIGGEPTWGPVRPGQPDPERTGAGLDVLAQVGSEMLGTPDFSSADLESDTFLVPFSRLERAVPSYAPPAGSPFAQMLLERGPTTYDAAGAYESEAGPALVGTAVRNDLKLLYPAPVVTAGATFTAVREAPGADALRRAVTGDAGRAAMARAGWRVPGEPHAPGVPRRPALPTTSGMPTTGAVQALLATWQQVTG